MDVALTFHGVDLAPWLASYTVEHEIVYPKVITTLDGVEHAHPGTRRPVITFTLRPLSDAAAARYYEALSALIASVTYTDTWLGADRTLDMRVVSDLGVTFGLRGPDRTRYYRGGEIKLRGVSVIA